MKKEKFTYEFRDDKLERGEAAKFNIEASKRILLLAGITEDNPDYKRYFALTAINVHSTFLYGTYSDSVEEMFVKTLENRDMTIDQYKGVTKDYDWESVYAHKQWVIKENDVVYHYYCAVNESERFIALATSRGLKIPTFEEISQNGNRLHLNQ